MASYQQRLQRPCFSVERTVHQVNLTTLMTEVCIGLYGHLVVCTRNLSASSVHIIRIFIRILGAAETIQYNTIQQV